MPNAYKSLVIPDYPDLADGVRLAKDLIDSGGATVRFANAGARDSAFAAPAKGQVCFLDQPTPRIQFFDGITWVDWYVRDPNFGWRDPRVSWGRLGSTQATIPPNANPPDPDIVLVGPAHLVYEPVTNPDYGLGTVVLTNPGERLWSIEGRMRVDGGNLGADGTLMWKFVRKQPAIADVEPQTLVAVPALSAAGGGSSSVVTLQAYDVPPAGVVEYELQAAKRIPAESGQVIRVRWPVGFVVVDLGPRPTPQQFSGEARWL